MSGGSKHNLSLRNLRRNDYFLILWSIGIKVIALFIDISVNKFINYLSKLELKKAKTFDIKMIYGH